MSQRGDSGSPKQEPDQQQLPRLGDHGLEQAEDDERPDVDREEGAAADAVGQPADERRAEEIPMSVEAATSPLQTGVSPGRW